jgi:hypothetical protein
MKCHLMFLLGVVAGCASSAMPAPDVTRDLVQDNHGRVIRTSSEPGIESTLPMDINAAYAAVGTAYMRLGIELATRNPQEHVLGNMSAVGRGTLHGRSLSRYFNCGNDVTGEPLADSRRISISAISTLSVVDSATTRVKTLVSGAAISSGTSTTPSYCATTGLLERELLTEASK